MQPRIGTIFLLGFGLLGISLLWTIYNANVPLFLQAGRPDFPTLPGIKGYALDARSTAFILSLDNLAALFILPYVGAWSDRTRTRWGRRKPFIMIGAPVAALAFVCIPLTVGLPLAVFMTAVAVTLVAMDFFRTPTVALMPDLVPPEGRSPANGVINLMAGVGAALALGVGGMLFDRSPALTFLFGGIGMLLGSAILLVAIREPVIPQAPDSEPGLLASLQRVLADRDRSALFLLAAIFFWFLSYSALESFFTSFAVKHLGQREGRASQLLQVLPIALVLGALPAGFIGRIIGRRTAILVGLVLFGLLLGWGFTLATAPPFRILLALAGLAWALVLVNSLPMVLDFAPVDRDGAYTGMYYMASMLSAVIGPNLAGWVVDLTGKNYRMLFLYGPVTIGIAVLLLLCVRPRRDPAGS